jgi:hypothetical protein
MTTAAPGQHVDQLTAMLYPHYTKACEHCGGYVVATPEEALQRWTEAAYEPLTSLAKAWQTATVPGAGTTTPVAGLPSMAASPWTSWKTKYHRHRDDCDCHHHGHEHHRHHGDHCRCRDCEPDDCHCRCCIVNADLVVSARLGERRLVPITIENNRRREREIKLELSEFSSKGGSGTEVTGQLLGDTEFTLAACEQREAIVGIEVGGRAAEPKAVTAKDREEGKVPPRRPDVDDCEVAYADLRIVGCESRPVRIAVATLPRDCHAYPVDCACDCCC